MKKIPVGGKISANVPIETYYSGYGGRPKMTFFPGMTGTVAAIAPKVRRGSCCGRDWFYVVDYDAPETGRVERVGICACEAAEAKEGNMSTEGTIWLQVPGTADYEGYDDVEDAGYALGQRLGLRPFVKFKHIPGIMKKAKVSDRGLSVEYSPAKIYLSGRDYISVYEGDSEEGEWLGPLSPEMWDAFLAAMERGLAFSTHYGE